MPNLLYKPTKLNRSGKRPLELSLALLSEASSNRETAKLYMTLGQNYVLQTVVKDRHESAKLLHNAAQLIEYAANNRTQMRAVNAAGIYKQPLKS